MRKKIVLGLTVAVLCLAKTISVDAAEIKGIVKQYTNEVARTFVQQPNGRFNATQPAWAQAPNLNRVGVTITNEAGTVVYSGETTTISVGGSFSAPNLPAGTYTVTVASAGLTPLPFATGMTIQPQMQATVTLSSDNDVQNLYWILASQSKRVLAISKHGTFPEGQTGTDQNNTPINYRVWYQGGDVVSTYSTGGINYVYFKGALVGDTLGLYASALTVPTLSDEEKAYGWSFKGWRINQDARLYSGEEVSNLRISEDITLEAIFEAPTYTVTFATDEEKGSIEGQATVSYSIEGNTSSVSDVINATVPTATAKPGYTFMGWYSDHTTNVIDETSLLSTNIKSNLVYYAKYIKDDLTIEIGANGNWFIDGVDTGKPSQGSTGAPGKDADPLTVTATDLDAEGNTVVTFSDGSKVTLKKGADGQAGATPTISIDANGYWVIDGIVTSAKAQGEDGSDGVTPDIKIGTNGNWFVNGSDTGVSSKAQLTTGQTNEAMQAAINTFSKAILPATGTEQGFLLAMAVASGLLVFGGYSMGRSKEHK